MNLTRTWKSIGALLALVMTVAWSSQENTLTPIGNKTACPGDSVTFTTTAGGATPYKFTWKKNGVVIANQTNTSLTLAHVAPPDSATYTVILKGGANSVTNSGTLTVTTGVTATPLPNLSRFVGSIAVFSTTPSGTGPFTFTWKKNGTTINGQTGSSLTLTNVSVSDNGTYSVIVSGACGNPVTETGTLIVDTCFPAVDVLLVIDRSGSMTGKPYFDALAACSNFVQNLHYTNGDQAGIASYNSAATLDQTLTNKLSKLDQSISLIPGATGFTSVSLGLQTGQGELVSVRHQSNSLPVLVLLSDGLPTGGDTSSNALYWASQAKIAGTRIFTVGLGSVNAALLKGIASSTNDYYFTTNSAQLVALFNAVSTVICRPPTNIVVTGLSSLTVCAGDTANFGVTATGCDSYRYQWIKNGTALAGKTNSVLTLSNVATTDAGVYSVAVLSGCQNVTNSATLTVNASTIVSVPPSSVTNCPGSPASFHVTATGTQLTYQWYKGVSALAGQTNSTLTLNSISSTDAGTYDVVISGVCGLPVTNSAALVVNASVVVATAPSNATACPSSTANFSVNATGTGLTYQWYKGTTLLNGKTASTLTLNNVSGADAGSYSVVVNGVCGAPVTNSATLFVNANTVVSTAPSNATNCPGTTANFSVNATGTGLTYQWYKGTALLNGKTASTLALPSVAGADTGTYSVVIAAVCGVPVTNSAMLFVNANTVVATAPSNTTNCPGTTANFSVNATGTGLTYQWYKGVNLLGGQTSSTLTLNNVSGTDAGSYSVIINGVCGTPATNSATLFVNANTVVVTAPSNATNCPGTTANFSVNATGTSLTYQWYKGVNLLGGQTSSTLTLNNVTGTDAGSYSVVVSGVCGTPVTNNATLFVNANVLVTVPPSNATNCPGTTANFSVNATGTGLTFQWFKAASPLAGQTNNILALPNVTAADAGLYSVVVSGTCGSALTNGATLTVNSNALMTIPPSNATNCPGTTASFSANAGGTGLTFQWYKGASLLLNQTNAVLMLSNVSAADAGIYNVTVIGACGVPITNSATLAINTNALVTVPPANATNCPGSTANFSVNATGTGLTYQWYESTNSLDNETNSTLTITNVSAADAGTYSVVVSGVCGAPLTNSATLTVNSNVIVTVPPSNATNCPGSSASFSVNATGTGLTYQWYKLTSILPGETNSTLTLANLTVLQGGQYFVVISGVCGVPVTNSATLVVYANATILTGPVNATNCPGATANFSVDARGNNLSYQWYKGVSLLSGKTTSVLTLNNVSATDAGTYSVVVSGICGTPVTNSATLTINSGVVITVPPVNLTNCPGTTVHFSVNATGTGLTYQWYKGTVILGGSGGSTLTLLDVGPKDAGTFSVVVSGTCGLPVTNSAVLVVNSNTVVAVPPVNSTNCPGTTANFSVNAGGTGLVYQWYKGTSALAGQTNSTLTLNSVTAANAGTYNVVITGVCAAPITNSASLVVNTNVLISFPPANSTNCPGTPASFSVTAGGTGVSFQWYKGTSLLSGQTNSTLTLANVSASDAGIYNVVVTGTCSAPVTNSATLVVNSNVVIATPPSNSTNCPNTTASFSVNATGTGLTYQWYGAGTSTNLGPLLTGQTNSVLTLNNVTLQSSGVYHVIVSGVCGNAVTNAALLAVNKVTSVAPLASVTNNIGTSVTFTAVASGTGPFNYQWFKGATALTGQTNKTLTLNNLQPADSGTYSVSVTGACGIAATSAAVLTINLPPVVFITYPTNGTIFVTPATFTVLAAASDPDGVVTNVTFYSSTNGVDFVFLGATNASPFLTIASNLPPGHYTFVARATDNFGATGDSAPVSVDVVPVEPPEVTIIGNLTLNTQDGFQWLTNIVCNPLYSHANALRVDIHNITNSSIRVVNASGTNNGVPFIISAGAINPGTCWTNIIKFYDPLQLAFYPMLTVQLVDPVGVGEPDGQPQAIFSGKFLRDGTFLVEFTTVPGVTYYIQYSSDMVHWKTVFPPFAGTGQRTQWIDSGPPGTESFPTINDTRFYRVLLAQ